MIPKKIHYIWFGNNPKPDIFQICFNSWKKFCPDYEIFFWNEQNFDVMQNSFTQKAYETKNYVLLNDYARLKIVHDHGGVYLDLDVELLKNIDKLLQFDFYMGFQENDNNINPGLGFGSIKHHWLLQQLIKKYEQVSLIDSFWKEYNPDPETITAFIESFGINLSKNKTTKFKNTVFLSSIYLDPLPFLSYKIQITKKAYSLHHYAYTWADKKNDFYQVYKKWTEFTKNKK